LKSLNKNTKENDSSKQIIKSTSIVGGSQLIQIVLSIIRTKFVAVILGASGVGLMGLYITIMDVVRNSTSCGINFSGVRDIAEAKASNNSTSISKSVLILQRWAAGTGLIGLIITVTLCIPISKYTFSNSKYALSIALLSITLLLSSISQGQIALLQGMQHISSMAKAGIWGAVLSCVIAIPIYFFWGIDGIVPSLIIMSIVTVVISSVYVRIIKVEKVSLTAKQSFFGGLKMAKFGLFIVANSLVNTIMMFFLKSFITKKSGLHDVGLYQAVLTITNTYLGVLLNSLLADYYPRLSANAANKNEINRLVNEQCEITLLLGGPLMILLLSLSPVVISFLYSNSFLIAVPLLQWHIVGSFLVIIGWPVGVIFLGTGKGKYAFLTEMSLVILYIFCIMIGWNSYGINILGMAYCLKAAIGILIVLLLTKKLTGYTMSIKILKIIFFFSLLVSLCVVNLIYNRGVTVVVINSIICILASGFTFISLRKILNFKNIIQRFLIKIKVIQITR